MGLVRTALIFGAGYVLGRPEGRAKVAALANRPEVAQLRQQATSTVISGVKSGKEQLTKATDRAVGNASEQASPSGNDSGPNTARRGRRLPSFPKRGARHAASTATATAPTSAARETTTTSDISTANLPTSDRATASTAATGTTLTNTGSTSTGPTAQPKPAGVASDEPDAAPAPPTAPRPTDGPTT
jgi:hypothetical protein